MMKIWRGLLALGALGAIGQAEVSQADVNQAKARQHYSIPVSVRAVAAEGQAAAKLTESETFQSLWQIATGPMGRVVVRHRRYSAPATLVGSGSRMAMILTLDDFLGLVGLSRDEDQAQPTQAQMVEVPMWSYPAGVQFTASSSATGYLSFYITTGGELPAS